MTEEDTLGPGWEAVTVDICGVPTLRRIEVPGGWLYLAGILGEGATLCFVPTPHPTETVHYLLEDREAVERLNAATDARWRASGYDRK